jgi:RHS repeat-associated protein
LFDPETFSVVGKLVGSVGYSITADHLGTPNAMYDAAGNVHWSATVGAYGDLRDVTGDEVACPFRWPGQQEDAETGLYYNRFRYYEPAGGIYLSRDPLRLRGGMRCYGYVSDTVRFLDPYGLIDPFDILFSQDSVSHDFSDGPWAGRCITEAIEEARALGHLPEGLELNVMVVNDQFVTLNNRTLLVAQEANLVQVHPNIVGPSGINKLNQLLDGRMPQQEQPVVNPCKK